MGRAAGLAAAVDMAAAVHAQPAAAADRVKGSL
jgi:hypothetical protein